MKVRVARFSLLGSRPLLTMRMFRMGTANGQYAAEPREPLKLGAGLSCRNSELSACLQLLLQFLPSLEGKENSRGHCPNRAPRPCKDQSLGRYEDEEGIACGVLRRGSRLLQRCSLCRRGRREGQGGLRQRCDLPSGWSGRQDAG